MISILESASGRFGHEVTPPNGLLLVQEKPRKSF